jgi:hypothetical protein
MVYAASISAWIAISVVGRWLLALAGMRQFSLFGGCFVFGYGTFGLGILLSLRYFEDGKRMPIVLSIVIAVACLLAYVRRSKRQTPSSFGRGFLGLASAKLKTCDIFGSNAIVSAIVLPWVACAALVYLPIGEYAGTPSFNLPEIFDLPKHLFAQRALFQSTQWPVGNPFFYGQPFAYNLLFYGPAAFVAKLFDNPLANFQTFPVFALAVAVSLPLTVLDIVCICCRSSVARISAALISTWVGGFTPLFVHMVPTVGYALLAEGFIHDILWVDETFLSVIFVPQHILAVLCALVSMTAIATVRDTKRDWPRVLISAAMTSAGALSSLILMPHLIASYCLGLVLLLVLAYRERGDDFFGLHLCGWIVLGSLPAVVLLPFALEAKAWSGGLGPFFALPAHWTQWPYLLGCFGLIIPLAGASVVALTTNLRQLRTGSASHHLANLIILSLVGAAAYLFLSYPDVGIKSGLWLRIVLVAVASVGLQILLSKIESRRFKRIAKYGVFAVFMAIAAINAPLIMYFVNSPPRPLDKNLILLISFVRTLPLQARLVLLTPDQRMAAMLGRNVDFDFSPIRADAYLPPEGRGVAKQFWDGLAQKNPDSWRELEGRYDYAIVIAPSLATQFPHDHAPIAQYGAYSVYRLGG